ncbi:MAG: hypothetical protein EBX95_05145, partial [Acidimicrobiia bacterium]|nr:hypothetical protein [Acidimicrobiia bacterium]
MVNLQEITFETNGTQELTDEFGDFLHKWVHFRRQDALTFSVSPKLSVSGEKWSEAIKPKIVAEYQQLGYVYLKF